MSSSVVTKILGGQENRRAQLPALAEYAYLLEKYSAFFGADKFHQKHMAMVLELFLDGRADLTLGDTKQIFNALGWEKTERWAKEGATDSEGNKVEKGFWKQIEAEYPKILEFIQADLINRDR